MSSKQPRMRALVAVVVTATAALFAVGGTGSSFAAAAASPGITSDSITIGVVYLGDLGKAVSQIGGPTETIGQLPVAKAIIQHFNDNGGLAGRQIKPVFYNYIGGIGSSTMAQREQEMCSLFTEDNKSFAVTGFPTVSENLVTCVTKAGAEYVSNSWGGTPSFDNANYKQIPQTIWQPSNTTTDLAWSQTVQQLDAAGYFTKGAKVGVLNYDSPVWERGYENAGAKALKAAGVKVVQVATVKTPSDASEVATTQAQGQTAVLQFKSAGITHVLIAGSAGGFSNFVNTAQSQDFHPRYGLMTAGSALTVSSNPSDTPQQLNKAMLFGWNPYLDVGASTAASTECQGWVTQAGASITGAISFANDLCDSLTFIGSALKKAGSTVNASTFAKAGEGLGAVKPAMTQESQVAKGQHAGTRIGQVAKYKDGCVPPTSAATAETTCWAYTGKPVSFPSG